VVDIGVNLASEAHGPNGLVEFAGRQLVPEVG